MYNEREKGEVWLKLAKLWEPLRQAQAGEGFVRAVQLSLYTECETRVKVDIRSGLQTHSEWFKVDHGCEVGLYSLAVPV